MSDDITFINVAVGCLGNLISPKPGYSIYLATVQYEPIKGTDSPLGPRETRDFHIWYGVGHLNMGLNSAQVIEKGYSRWCHVLAARAENLSDVISDLKKQLER
jgi:hypothetical protein